jgi:hypothetical protein
LEEVAKILFGLFDIYKEAILKATTVGIAKTKLWINQLRVPLQRMQSVPTHNHVANPGFGRRQAEVAILANLLLATAIRSSRAV